MIAKRVRFRPIDAVIIVLVIAAGVYVYWRIAYGLEYRGDWSVIPRFLVRRDAETGRPVANFLLIGLITTLKLSIWAALLAMIAGFLMGMFRTSKNLFLQLVGRTYVELIRNLPPLVLIYIFYFFVVDQIMPLLGVETFIRTRPENVKAVLAILFAQESLFVQFISGVFTIAFFEGAYFIIMPQAIRRVLPPLANEFINTIKYSSLASVVSIQELTYMGKQVQVATRFIFEPWITVALMYLILTLSLSLGVSRLEKRMSRSD